MYGQKIYMQLCTRACLRVDACVWARLCAHGAHTHTRNSAYTLQIMSFSRNWKTTQNKPIKWDADSKEIINRHSSATPPPPNYHKSSVGGVTSASASASTAPPSNVLRVSLPLSLSSPP